MARNRSKALFHYSYSYVNFQSKDTYHVEYYYCPLIMCTSHSLMNQYLERTNANANEACLVSDEDLILKILRKSLHGR